LKRWPTKRDALLRACQKERGAFTCSCLEEGGEALARKSCGKQDDDAGEGKKEEVMCL